MVRSGGGLARQATLSPESLEDYIAEDGSGRVVDAFVDELDLQSLGIRATISADTGRPAFHELVIAKLSTKGWKAGRESARRPGPGRWADVSVPRDVRSWPSVVLTD